MKYSSPTNISSQWDYDPFGMLTVGRSWSVGSEYRFSFNGKEHDDEIKGSGNSIDYKERIYDPRLGRFLSVDKLTSTYPFYTTYQFAGNMPIIAIDLDGLEPKYMISENGRLTKPMITLLNAAFNYNINRMEKTKWKEVSFDFGAITLYKTVRYDHAYTDDNDAGWARTIVHEHKHRNEIGNFIGRAIGWYIGYGIGYIGAGFSYEKNNAEERAYGMEPNMDALMAFDGGIAMKIIQNDKFGDGDKSAALRYVGLSYKLGTQQNKLGSLKTQLENYDGSDRGKRRSEKKIAQQENTVNSLQTTVNTSKTEQVDKVITEVKKSP